MELLLSLLLLLLLRLMLLLLQFLLLLLLLLPLLFLLQVLFQLLLLSPATDSWTVGNLAGEEGLQPFVHSLRLSRVGLAGFLEVSK